MSSTIGSSRNGEYDRGESARIYAGYVLQVRDRLAEHGPAEMDATLVVMGAIRLAHLATVHSDEAVMRHHGLSFSRFRTLFGLSAIGPMTSAELAATFDISRATTTKLVESLERDALISRRANPSDGRSSILSITAAGDELLSAAHRDQNDFQQSFLENLTLDERHQLGQLLTKALTGPDSTT